MRSNSARPSGTCASTPSSPCPRAASCGAGAGGRRGPGGGGGRRASVVPQPGRDRGEIPPPPRTEDDPMTEPRVLVVDDEKSMRELLAITMERQGSAGTVPEGGGGA